MVRGRNTQSSDTVADMSEIHYGQPQDVPSILRPVVSVQQVPLFHHQLGGHDESTESTNRGNFIELIKLHGRANKEIDDVVLENATKNAKYTSPGIQKEILKIIADCVRHKIREEIGDAKFCILVDEVVDESHNEQMAIILRYVDSDGFVRERFFEVVSVKDTNALTLKKEICVVLSASAKRHSQLKSIRENEIDNLIAAGEVPTGTGANQKESDILCQALQMKDQDILNAMHFVSSTKLLLQEMRDDRWESFIWYVVEFCRSDDIDVPELTDRYMDGTRRYCQQKNNITMEDYYHFQIFNAVIDFQLMELNNRFMEKTIELLKLCEALNPTDGFKSFSIDAICGLAEEFYPLDFNKEEIPDLKRQLDHYKFDVIRNQQFQNLNSLPQLCRMLVEMKKSQHYFLIDRLIRLVLTLPVSTATTERAFSGMKLIKTSLRNKMENEFLANTMIIYIEREIALGIDTEILIDKFELLGNRRLRLK
ncbi:uncharacterized protein LOC127806362 [Diospyros lotus]|uniref:uncharacterized protein LOC127806362 n=1 Tax=Diospyros lotus TaxID=55363 RepID=UPI002256FBD9|nr:uncharacterized protein LOC127806362 [Diospyros lotus]